MNVRHWLPAVFLAALCATQAADQSPKWGDWPKWGDQGDGSYRNPVVPADYTDIFSWGNYRGDRIGLYSYNEREEAGYVDVDYLHYTYR